MTPDGKQSLGNRQITITQGPVFDGLLGQIGFQFSPELDSFQQGPRLVQPRQSKTEGRIHVKMGVHKRRGKHAVAAISGH